MAKHVDIVARAKKWANVAAIVRVVPTALIWVIFLSTPKGVLSLGFPGMMAIFGTSYLVAGIGLTAGMHRGGMPLARQTYFLFSYFAILIGSFSTAYWTYGRTPYFNTDLTRLDALYFAIGTLSTAGTGSFVGTSELIRAIQIVQMIIDLGLVLFTVAAVVARFSTSDNGSPPAPS